MNKWWDTEEEPMKKIPDMWWDFEDPNFIIVETTMPDYPIIAKFPFPNNREAGEAAPAIAKAEKFMDDLRSGRKTFKEIGVSLKGQY